MEEDSGANTNVNTFESTVTMSWIKTHLENGFNDPSIFLNMYQSQRQNQINHFFLRTILSTKYRWEWIDDAIKEDTLTKIDNVLKTIKEKSHTTISGTKQKMTSIYELRAHLEVSGWKLL